MLIRNSMKKMLRNPRQMIAHFFIFAVITAFICLGLNVRNNVRKNIDVIYNSYDIVAIPRFYTMRQDTYIESPAQGYDLTAIINTPGTISVDVRSQFGAYVMEPNDYYVNANLCSQTFAKDVIIFSVNSARDILIPHGQEVEVPVTVEWSATNIELSVYSDCLSIKNDLYDITQLQEIIPEDERYAFMPHSGAQTPDDADSPYDFLLQAGQSYIMSCEINYRSQSSNAKIISISKVTIDYGSYHTSIKETISRGVWEQYDLPVVTCCMPLEPYSDDIWDTTVGYYFTQAIQSCRINSNSLTVVSTNDLATMLPFHQNNVYLTHGRAFEPNDYDISSKVCLISDQLASICGWNVGDIIDLSFFESNYLPDGLAESQISQYNSILFDKNIDTDTIGWPICNMYEVASTEYNLPFNNFFSQGQFTIIGIYSGEVTGIDRMTSSITFDSGLDWRTIIIPDGSVENMPIAVPNRYNTSIRLDPLEVQAFMAELTDRGILNTQINGYELRLSIYDQGISSVAPTLGRLTRVSKLLLYLAFLTTLLSVWAVTILYVGKQKQNIAILRSLGVPKKQVLLDIQTSLLLPCIIGSILGALISQISSNQITQWIVLKDNVDSIINVFTPTIVQGNKTYELQSYGNLSITIFSVTCVFLLLVMISTALTIRQMKKPILLQLKD